jgi:type IV pilus assembly protein PilB
MANTSRDKRKFSPNRGIDKVRQDLVADGLVAEERLREAEAVAAETGETLQSVLIQSKVIPKEDLVKFIGDKIQVPYIDLKDYAIDRKVLDLVPEKLARRYRILPLFLLEGELTVAMADPLDLISLGDITAVVAHRVEPVIASEDSIIEAIDQWYGVGNIREDLVGELVEEIKEKDHEVASQFTDTLPETVAIRLKKEAEEPPIVRLVNSYIVQAMLEGASDIHFKPKRDGMRVRFRIDGFLYDRHNIPAKLIAPVTSRIKIMSLLDISKKRVPQDGRIGLTIRNRDLDIRTSTFPTMHGENIVLRLLDKTKGIPTLADLGFSEKDLEMFTNIVKATKGIILATGPTGSGKTTTIYSTINSLDTKAKNIMTVEDPIEYEIDGIVQSQVDVKAGLTFASSLKSILRQDPDIIYVGEIRDLETAEIAVRSALTGHLVVSTLHTNDAVGSIMRLRDIGVESALIESVLKCSFAQRLVRKLCQKCKEMYKPDESIIKEHNLSPDTVFYRAVGCAFCHDIGYNGRTGIFEILIVDKDIRKLITDGASEGRIAEAAKAHGKKTLFEDGLEKVVAGLTTYEEVMRVTEEVE